MTILCDSREKWTQRNSKDSHIKKYFEKHGIEYRVEALKVGDYMMEGGTVTVDRKESIEEIRKNLTNAADKKRFWNEVRRAHKTGLRLVVLVEIVETDQYKCVRDLVEWKSEYTPVAGYKLIREMNRLRLAYGVEFRFCPKVSAARRILEILEDA